MWFDLVEDAVHFTLFPQREIRWLLSLPSLEDSNEPEETDGAEEIDENNEKDIEITELRAKSQDTLKWSKKSLKR